MSTKKLWGGEVSGMDHEYHVPTAKQMAKYMCANCNTSKYIREDFAPPVLICLKCERPIKAQVIELNLRKHAEPEDN